MSTTNLAVWALSLMLNKAPPSKLATLPAFPGYEETVEERTERYRQIADTAVAVGKTKHVIAILLAVSYHESGWAPDVDKGPCYRGADGKGTRCDGGRSSCIFQIHIGNGTTPEGWTQDDLFADREKCFKAGLHLIRVSEKSCLKLGPDHALDAFAGGFCDASGATMGHKRGFELVSLVRRFDSWQMPTAATSDSSSPGT